MVEMQATLIESGIGDPDAPQAESAEITPSFVGARLIGIQCVFDVTNDDKDHDTVVDVSVDNHAVLMGAGRVGSGETWGDWSQHVRGIPVVNAIDWDEGQRGKVIVTISPNGDDEWHFNFTVLMTYERGGWLRRGWTGVNLAEDRRSVTLAW